MPFAEVAGGVAGLLEQPRQQRDLRIKPIGHPPRDVLLMTREVFMHAVPRREMPGDDRRPTRRADGVANGELMEVGPLASQTVEVRRLDVRMTVAS